MSYIGGWRTGGRTKKCHNCQDPGHLSWACKEPKKCNNCQVPGHLAWECKEPRKAYGGGYAGAAARAVGGAGEEMDGGNRKDEEVRNLGTEKQVKAFWKKISFKRGMEMNHARMERGMKEKNYLLLLHKTGGEVTLAKIVEILDEMGIDFMQVMAINQHPDKLSSCVEILFKPELDVDLGEMNRKVGEIGLDYDVDPIGYSTETVHVRRIPLTANPKEVVDLIRQAISPYITRIVDISPTCWKLTEKAKEHRFNMMLDGKLDGNYRVRFVPLEKVVIPGFIPIGPECVKAEVRYGKQDDRNLLCSNCFLEGHMKGDSACTASVEEGWMAYVDRFNQKSAELAAAQGLPANAYQGEMEKLQKKYDELEDLLTKRWNVAESRYGMYQRSIDRLEEKGVKLDGKEIDPLIVLRAEMRKKDKDILRLKAYLSGLGGVVGGDWEDLSDEMDTDEEDEEVNEAYKRIREVEERNMEEEIKKKEAEALKAEERKKKEDEAKEKEAEEKSKKEEEEKKETERKNEKEIGEKSKKDEEEKESERKEADAKKAEAAEEKKLQVEKYRLEEQKKAKKKEEEEKKKVEERKKAEAKKEKEDRKKEEEERKKAEKEKAKKKKEDKKKEDGKKKVCKDCDGCTPTDCGACENCLDMKKFGGPNKRKQACKMKVCQKNKTEAAAEKRKQPPPSQIGERDSPEGKTLRKDESQPESLHLPISLETPAEEVSESPLDGDLEEKLPEEEILRKTTDLKSLETSDVEKDLTRELSWANEMENGLEEGSVVFASTSNETPSGTPTVTPKVSPMKKATDTILSGIGFKRSPLKQTSLEFGNVEFKKSLSKNPDFGNVSHVQSRIKGWEDKGLLEARTTRKSLSDRNDL